MRRALVAVLCGVGLVTLVSRDARAEDRPTNVFFALGPINLHGNDTDTLTLGLGAFDAIDNETSAAGMVEYRFGRKVFFVGLALGLMANVDGGLFGHAGIYSDFSYKSVYLTPQLAMGGYGEGSSRDLGGVFQFRQSIDLAYRFDNGHRLGIKVAHISNAGIHDTNPGEEEFYLTYSFALGPYL
jgi:lipid A 3-O-deacylase